MPFLYLGLPVGANPKSKAVWNPIIEKFESKLTSWKGQYLSSGGRITLIKLTLSNLPVYYISMFKMLVEIINSWTIFVGIFFGKGKARKGGCT